MKPRYPKMELYQEIIFLKHWFKGKYCIENVITYYKPLVEPQESNNHYFWANFFIPPLPKEVRHIRRQSHNPRLNKVGFDLKKYKLDKIFEKQIINNCVEPETGKYILDRAIKQEYQTLF